MYDPGFAIMAPVDERVRVLGLYECDDVNARREQDEKAEEEESVESCQALARVKNITTYLNGLRLYLS